MTRTGLRRLVSVAAGPLVLFGCATHAVEFPPQTPRGHIAARPGRPGLVVAAPHGSSDVQTGEIAAEVARRTGFGLVVATGFNLEPDTRERPGRRYQVNRPFEGAPSRPPSEDTASAGARLVYETFERRVREIAQGPLRFYAEIHGNNRRESANRIEIATVGVDKEYAQRLRALCELVRDAHLRGHAQAPRLEVLVEPADPIFYAASGAKREGILKLPERAALPERGRRVRGLRVAVVCGGGGNAGDGFVVARRLKHAGARPDVLLTAPPDALRGDAALKYQELRRVGIVARVVEDAAKATPALERAGVIVDALLGTGAHGAPAPLVAALIEAINASGRPVVALDVPSGLPADGGRPEGPVVSAWLTPTFAAPKLGLVLGPGAE